MRFKFRAWDKQEKRMWWNVQDAYDTLHCHNYPENTKYWDCNCKTHDFMPSSFGSVLSDDNYVVMQFIGILDKNGKEIYEGDILCPTTPSTYINQLYIADRHCLAFGFKGTVKGINQFVDYTWDTITNGSIEQVKDLEVVGSIYENAELLYLVR